MEGESKISRREKRRVGLVLVLEPLERLARDKHGASVLTGARVERVKRRLGVRGVATDWISLYCLYDAP